MFAHARKQANEHACIAQNNMIVDLKIYEETTKYISTMPGGPEVYSIRFFKLIVRKHTINSSGISQACCNKLENVLAMEARLDI